MSNLTNNRQTPRYGKLNALGYDRGDFVFQIGKPDVPVAAAPATPPNSEAAQAWAAVKDTSRSADLEAFLRRYGDSFYGDLARGRIEELKKSQVAVVAPPVTPTASAVSSSARGKAPVTVSLSSRTARPLLAAEECALKPKDVFRECERCPEMVVVPSGSFTMGSPSSEPERDRGEDQERVAIPKPFAVGQYAVTFDEWDACVADGGCGGYRPSDLGWGRGRRPVIFVSWDDAQAVRDLLASKGCDIGGAPLVSWTAPRVPELLAVRPIGSTAGSGTPSLRAAPSET